MSRSCLVVLALTLVLAPACAHAPGLASGGGPGGAPFAASPADLLAAGKAAGRPGDAQTVSLFEGVHYTLDAQGRQVWDLWRILQVHSDDAVRAHGILRVGFEPGFQDRPQIEARVITADGVVHRLDPSTLSVRGASDDADQEIDGGRDLVAPLPAVAPGAVIEEHVRITDREVLDPGGAYGRYLIGDRIPAQATRIELDAPVSLPLHYLVAGLPKVHPVVSTRGGRTHLIVTVGPRKAVDDLESNAPADLVQWPYFAFATGKSWQAVAKVYSKLVDRQIAGADLKAQVARAVAGATGRRARIDRILEKLSRRIRYTGIELGQGAIVPRRPAQTLARGFGDCKDKAALLVAWLRAAGIEAHVALLDTGDRHDVDPSLPALGVFDHAIVYVPGTPVLWIDPTDRERPAGSLPSGDSGRLALVAAPTTTGLLRIPAARAADNVFSDHREIDLPEHGWAKMTLKRTFTGRFAATYRSALAQGSEKRLHTHLEGFVKRRFQAKALDRLTHGPLDDLAAPVTVTLEMDRAGRGRSDGLRSAVAAVQDESLFDFLPDYLTGPADASAPERKTELILAEPYLAEIHYQNRPPGGDDPAPPAPGRRFPGGPHALRPALPPGPLGGGDRDRALRHRRRAPHAP